MLSTTDSIVCQCVLLTELIVFLFFILNEAWHLFNTMKNFVSFFFSSLINYPVKCLSTPWLKQLKEAKYLFLAMHVVFTLIWLTEETEKDKPLSWSFVSHFPQNVCLDRQILF